MFEIKRKVMKEVEVVEKATLAEFIGDKFRMARNKRGLKISDVETQLDGKFSHSHLSHIERGNEAVKLKDLEALCAFYAIDVRTLFGGKISEESL